jgi:hypothetical protein
MAWNSYWNIYHISYIYKLIYWYSDTVLIWNVDIYIYNIIYIWLYSMISIDMIFHYLESPIYWYIDIDMECWYEIFNINIDMEC